MTLIITYLSLAKDLITKTGISIPGLMEANELMKFVENKSVNENIVGAEWYKDCFKFRLAFERARFFPFTEADYSKGNYFDQIYLTNPILKNNLSFEFELIGLTNPLKPINTLIQNGLFN